MADPTHAPPPNLGIIAQTGFGDLPTGTQIGMILDTLRGGNSLFQFMANQDMARRTLDFHKSVLLGRPGQVTTPDDPGQDASSPGGAVAPQPAVSSPNGRLEGGLISGASPDIQNRALTAIMSGRGQQFIDQMTALPELQKGEIFGPNGQVTNASGVLQALQGRTLAEQMGKDYRMIGPDGAVRNMLGAPEAGAEIAGRNAGAVVSAQLPSELQKIRAQGDQSRATEGFKLSNTPTTIDVEDGNGGTTQATMSQAQAAKGFLGKRSFGPVDALMMPDLVKGVADRQEMARKASESLADIGELRHALDGLPTGPGTETFNDVAAAAQKVGLNINDWLPAEAATDPAKFQVALKNMSKLSGAMAASMQNGARFTNADLMLAARAIPNMMMSPDALKTVTDNIEQLQRLKIERANFDRRYLFNNKNTPSLAMEDQWQNHVQSLKDINSDIKQSYLGVTKNVQGKNGVEAQPSGAEASKINLPSPLPDGSTVANVLKDKRTGKTGFQWRKPNGSLYAGDEQGNPY